MPKVSRGTCGRRVGRLAGTARGEAFGNRRDKANALLPPCFAPEGLRRASPVLDCYSPATLPQAAKQGPTTGLLAPAERGAESEVMLAMQSPRAQDRGG